MLYKRLNKMQYMKNRRNFLKVFYFFFMYLFSLKSTYIIAKEIRPYHHLSDGTFQNLPGITIKEFLTNDNNKFNFFRFFYKGIIKKEMFDRKEIPNDIPPTHALSQDQAIFEFNANKDNNSITWLGHASFLIRIKNFCILTDPYLTDIAGPFGIGPKRYVPSGIRIKELPKIDAILISHNHYDHLDVGTLNSIENKKNITIICPLNLSKIFYVLGFAKIIELDWNDSHEIENIKFTSVPAYHWSRRFGQKRNSSLWSGYVINSPSKNIYFSGDTAFGSIFKEIGKKLGPFDLSIVPIGAYLPRKIMQSSHCTPEEAVEITSMLVSNNILGMHWGTIRLSAENPWEPHVKFYNEALNQGYKKNQIWQLPIGGTKSLL